MANVYKTFHRVRFVGMADNDGLEFGLDPVTPVLFKFYFTRPAHIDYAWALPEDIVQNEKFQEFARKADSGLIMSFNELRNTLRPYRTEIPL